MTLTLDIRTPQDMLLKVRREKARLFDAALNRDMAAVVDHFFNFAVTAYHLKDWLQETPNAAYTSQDVLNYFEANDDLQICRDVALAIKHSKPTSRPLAASALSHSVSVSSVALIANW